MGLSLQHLQNSSSPRHQKFKIQPSAGKIMPTCCFDHRWPLYFEFKDPHVNIDTVRYSETLTNARTAIKNKRPGMIMDGVILLYDNTRPYITNIITSQIVRIRWEVLEHIPYSSNLSPCDFHVFGPLKQTLKAVGSIDMVPSTAREVVRHRYIASCEAVGCLSVIFNKVRLIRLHYCWGGPTDIFNHNISRTIIIPLNHRRSPLTFSPLRGLSSLRTAPSCI